MPDNNIKLPHQPSGVETESPHIAGETNLLEKARQESQVKGIALSDNLFWHLHWLVILVLYVAVLVLMVFGLWYLYTVFHHMLLPEELHYLNPSQAEEITQRLFTGSIGALLTVLVSGLLKYFSQSRRDSPSQQE